MSHVNNFAPYTCRSRCELIRRKSCLILITNRNENESLCITYRRARVCTLFVFFFFLRFSISKRISIVRDRAIFVKIRIIYNLRWVSYLLHLKLRCEDRSAIQTHYLSLSLLYFLDIPSYIPFFKVSLNYLSMK